MPMQSGDGTVYEELPRPERAPDPVMTTGEGTVMSGPDFDPTGTSATGTGSDAGDEDDTKAELYEKAKDADIEGRSTMTKKQLAKALDEV